MLLSISVQFLCVIFNPLENVPRREPCWFLHLVNIFSNNTSGNPEALLSTLPWRILTGSWEERDVERLIILSHSHRIGPKRRYC